MNTVIIKQYSTLPLLKYDISEKTLTRYNITEEMMDNVAVTFSMFDIENEEYVILNKKARIWYKEDKYEYPESGEYVLIYEFNKNETSKVGLYNCEFKLSILNPYCNILTLPNNEYIRVNIQPSNTKVKLI